MPLKGSNRREVIVILLMTLFFHDHSNVTCVTETA